MKLKCRSKQENLLWFYPFCLFHPLDIQRYPVHPQNHHNPHFPIGLFNRSHMDVDTDGPDYYPAFKFDPDCSVPLLRI